MTLRLTVLYIIGAWLGLGLIGCVGYGAKHLMDRAPHRDLEDWMIQDDDEEIEVSLVNGTTFYRMVSK